MTQIEIPSELPDILRSFTLSVLRTKPRDIIDHAVEYFTQLQQKQRPSSGKTMSSNKLPPTAPATTNVSSSSFSSTSQSQEHQQDLQSSNHNVILSGS
jgi:hypothetical protein